MTFPDLRPHFPHMVWRPEARAFGHLVGSDRDYDPNCWSITIEEAQILFRCVAPRDHWVIIGARLGWCAAHVAAAGADIVLAVDPELSNGAFEARFDENLVRAGVGDRVCAWPCRSDEFFDACDTFNYRDRRFSGFFVDGNHDAPCPLEDAKNCARYAAETAVVVFHDAHGRPIRQAAEWLMYAGWKARWFDTANGMIICWRGEFTPPAHTGDPKINWPQVRATLAPEFPFAACS